MRDENKYEYRAFYNEKMWDVLQLDYRIPQSVILTDGTIDLLNVPIEDVILMRNTGIKDISDSFVYEGDIIESHQGIQILDVIMLVKYGKYQAYCPHDEESMENIGFYVESDGYPQMPVGPLSEYALVVGNIYENAELIKERSSDIKQQA